MKKLFLILAAVLFVACQSPVIVQGPQGPAGSPGPSGQPGTDATVPEIPEMGDVKLAKWIRLPGSIVSRGNFGAFTDPDEALCNEPESVYLFYDDMSIVQYKPHPDGYANLAARASIACELQNRDNPEKPWDYVAVPPPPPPGPDTSHDPDLDPLHIAFCDNDGVIRWEYVAEDNSDYDRAVGTIPVTLELYNRDNDPDCHAVYGGRL